MRVPLDQAYGYSLRGCIKGVCRGCIKGCLATTASFEMAPIDFEHSDQLCEVEDCVEEIDDVLPDQTTDCHKVGRLFEHEVTNRLSPALARAHAIAEHAAHYVKTGSIKLKGVRFTRPAVANDELRLLGKWCTRVSDEFWKWHKGAPSCFATCPEWKLRNRPRVRVESITDKLFYSKCATFFGCDGRHRDFQSFSQIEECFNAFRKEQISDFLKVNSSA